MTSSLQENYRGNIRPAEFEWQATENQEEMLAAQNALMQKLQESEKKECIHVWNKMNLVSGDDCEAEYIRGMRMGAHIMFELLNIIE